MSVNSRNEENQRTDRVVVALSQLTQAVCGLREFLSQDCQTKTMLHCILQKVDDMGLKVSELKGEVAGLRAQVTKIFGEQQGKYDALVVEFDKLKASLDNAELPADVVTDLADFKSQLQAFDDQIPDTTA